MAIRCLITQRDPNAWAAVSRKRIFSSASETPASPAQLITRSAKRPTRIFSAGEMGVRLWNLALEHFAPWLPTPLGLWGHQGN